MAPWGQQDVFHAIWEKEVKTVEVSVWDADVRGPIDRTRDIKSLKDLPQELWTTVDKPRCGYN